MKELTVYQADDGSRWDERAGAIERDEEHAICMECETILGRKPSLAFNQYIQHDACTVDRFRVEMNRLATKFYGTTNFRVVCDMDNPVARLVYRFMRIDGQYREWQQPYYANHTPAKPVEVPK